MDTLNALGKALSGRSSPIIMSTVQSKGGVGKTSFSFSSCLFAVEKLGLNTLVIDLDQSGNLTSLCFDKDLALQLDNVETLYRADRRNEDALKSVKPTLVDYEAQFGVVPSGSLHILPAAPDLSFVDTSTNIGVIQQLKVWLATLDGQFDLVVIDTPGYLGKLSVGAMVASDYVLCPLELGEFGFQGIAAIETFIRDINEGFKSHKPIKALGYLPYKADVNTKEFRRYMSLFDDNNARHLLLADGDAVIERRVSVPAALNARQAPWNFDQGDSGAVAAGKNHLDVLTKVYSLVLEDLDNE